MKKFILLLLSAALVSAALFSSAKITSNPALPVVVDPSHGTGVRAYVAPMSWAAAACGADGLIVEVHPNPKEALSDGPQALDDTHFDELMRRLRPFVEAAGRTL